MIFADLIIVSLVLVALLISSISDIKTFEVPDFISYSLIISVLSARLIYSILTGEFNYFLYGLLGFVIMFILAHVLYYARFWGGGDSKLLMGLGAAFATKPYFINTTFNFLILLVLCIVVAGSVYGFVYSLILAYRHKKQFLKEFYKLLKTKRINLLVIAVLTLIPLILKYTQDIELLPVFFSPLILYLLLHYLILFTKAVENSCMYELIPVSKLTEGDWIADKKIQKKFEISYLGIEKHQIDLLRKAKVRKVLIKKGLPFTPAILIGTILALLL